MGEKKKQVYNALVEGATSGLSDKALYDYVLERCPKTSSKKIVRASLLALSDPDVMDRTILNTIYALAIKHRLDRATQDDQDDLDDDAPVAAPTIATKDEAVPATTSKPAKAPRKSAAKTDQAPA